MEKHHRFRAFTNKYRIYKTQIRMLNFGAKTDKLTWLYSPFEWYLAGRLTTPRIRRRASVDLCPCRGSFQALAVSGAASTL
eukprot:14884856-Alexandrium_andersonii.AAC.1